MAKAWHEEMDFVEDNAHDATDSVMPLSQSPLPTGDDYLILKHLANRHNLKIKDVPRGWQLFLSCCLSLASSSWSAACQWARNTVTADSLPGDHKFKRTLPWVSGVFKPSLSFSDS